MALSSSSSTNGFGEVAVPFADSGCFSSAIPSIALINAALSLSAFPLAFGDVASAASGFGVGNS